MVNLNTSIAPVPSRTSSRSAGAAVHAVLAIALGVAILALGAAHGLRLWLDGRAQSGPAPEIAHTHAITIGPQRYAVPASLLGDPVQRRDGFSERMDLTLALPLGSAGRLSEIEIAIVPRGRVRTSAALLDSVYLHQFAREHLTGAPGLVGKPLAPDAGTQGETVWYDPLSPAPFVAKCADPVDPARPGRTCLRVFSLADRNTAIVTFDPALLDNWRDFDSGVQAALETLRR